MVVRLVTLSARGRRARLPEEAPESGAGTYWGGA